MPPHRPFNGPPNCYTGRPITPPPVRRPGHPDRRTGLDHFTYPRDNPGNGLEPTSDHPSGQLRNGRVGRVGRDARRFHGRGCGRLFVNTLMDNEVMECAAPRGRMRRLYRERQLRPLLPNYSPDPPEEVYLHFCPGCIEVQLHIDYSQALQTASLHNPILLSSNWRPPPQVTQPMESVFLMELDILPQSRSVDEFANALATSSNQGEGNLKMKRAMRSRDFPPVRIKYLIDNWSSMVLDFELVESPAQFLGVGVGVADGMDVDHGNSMHTGDVNTLPHGNANGFTASNASAGIERGVDKLAARAYLGMVERYRMIPLHLSHHAESKEEMLHVLAAHSSLRKSYTSTVTPWLDQHYNPYTSGADIRERLQPATVAMINRMEDAIFPVTRVMMKGLKEGRNKWDARDPVKVSVFYFIWSTVLRQLCERHIRHLNAAWPITYLSQGTVLVGPSAEDRFYGALPPLGGTAHDKNKSGILMTRATHASALVARLEGNFARPAPGGMNNGRPLMEAEVYAPPSLHGTATRNENATGPTKPSLSVYSGPTPSTSIFFSPCLPPPVVDTVTVQPQPLPHPKIQTPLDPHTRPIPSLYPNVSPHSFTTPLPYIPTQTNPHLYKNPHLYQPSSSTIPRENARRTSGASSNVKLTDIETFHLIQEKCRTAWFKMVKRGTGDYELDKVWGNYRTLVGYVEASLAR